MDILTGGAHSDVFRIHYSVDGPQTITDLSEIDNILFNPNRALPIPNQEPMVANPFECVFFGPVTYDDVLEGLGGPFGYITTELRLDGT